jgi:hypothetical protein
MPLAHFAVRVVWNAVHGKGHGVHQAVRMRDMALSN